MTVNLTETTQTLRIERSRSGIPALWEEGGGRSNTGWARLIADQDGRPKKAIYVRRRGQLACAEHALVPIRKDDIVVEADHHRYDYTVKVYRIVQIREDEATLSLIADFDQGEWVPQLPVHLNDVVQAAMDKAADYHCRTPYWIRNEEEAR